MLSVSRCRLLGRSSVLNAHFCGCTAALVARRRRGGALPRSSSQRLQRLDVQANELNKWADRSNYDSDGGLPDDSFDTDTAAVVLRVLTARAVQKLLMQLQELDMLQAQWLNNYCSEHPPMEGNKFVTGLLRMQGCVLNDPTNGTTHTVDPQNLAHRVLQIRSALAFAVTKGFCEYVELENTTVMRSHLESFTYTAGSFADNNGRRGYFRRRPPGSQR